MLKQYGILNSDNTNNFKKIECLHMNNIIINKILEGLVDETIFNCCKCLPIGDADRDDDNSDKV